MSILKKIPVISMGIIVGFALISDSYATHSYKQPSMLKPINTEKLKNPQIIKDSQQDTFQQNIEENKSQQQSMLRPINTESLKMPSILDEMPIITHNKHNKSNKSNIIRSNSVIYTPITKADKNVSTETDKKQHKIGTCFYCENPKNGPWEARQCHERKEGYSCSPYEDREGLMMVYTGAKQTITPSNSFDSKIDERNKFNGNRLLKYKMIPDIKAPWAEKGKQSSLRNSHKDEYER